MKTREEFNKEIKYEPMTSGRTARNREEAREYRRQKMEEQRKERKMRKIRGIATLSALGIAAAAMAVVIPAEQKKQREKVAKLEREIRQEIANERAEKMAELAKTKETEIREEVLKTVEAEINSLEPTRDNILKNVKEQYLERYNEDHDSDIDLEDLKLMSFNADYILKTDGGKYVTHGDHPYEVMQYLDDNGIAYIGAGEGLKIYYSSADGEILEMITNILGEGYVGVVEGDNIENKINDNSTNTFLEMEDVIVDGIAWANTPESESAKRKYIKSLRELEEKEEEQDLEQNETAKLEKNNEDEMEL